MPNKDGTGPAGRGAGTGRGLGPCGKGKNFYRKNLEEKLKDVKKQETEEVK